MWPKTTKTHLDVTFPAENAVLNYSNTEPEITLRRIGNYVAQDRKLHCTGQENFLCSGQEKTHKNEKISSISLISIEKNFRNEASQ